MQKICRAFLWTGLETVQNGKCLVAWSQVQQLLQLGGPIVLDIHMLSIALHVHWLWLERSKPPKSWAAIKVGTNKVTSAFFGASISLVLSNGVSFLFWTDPWLHGRHIVELAPDVFDTMSLSRRKQHMVASAMVTKGA
jgi:hypothetical protein